MRNERVIAKWDLHDHLVGGLLTFRHAQQMSDRIVAEFYSEGGKIALVKISEFRKHSPWKR